MSDEFEKIFLTPGSPSLERQKSSHQDGKDSSELPFKVCIDDNFHYMDASERTTHGAYATAEEAIEACKAIVRESVQSGYKPGMSAKALFSYYTSFGDDPFVLSSGGKINFSAWDYARQLCHEICGE